MEVAGEGSDKGAGTNTDDTTAGSSYSGCVRTELR